MIYRFSSLFLFFFVSIFSMGADKVVVLKSDKHEAYLEKHALEGTNVKYVVKSNFNLNGKTYKLKRGSTIEFDGGCFSNGTLYLENNTSVKGQSTMECGRRLKVQIGGGNVNINNLRWSNDQGVALLSYASCQNLTIENCYVTSMVDNSVKIVADNVKDVIKNITIKYSTFTFKRMGIEIQNHGNNEFRYDGLYIHDCSFYMVDGRTNYGFAVSLSGYGKNAVVNNNMFFGNSVGVELVGFSKVAINSNQFQGITSKTIVCSNKRKMQDITIENNEINSPSSKIQISNTDRLFFRNNTITISYIELIGCSDCNISNNDIVSKSHYAIIMDGGAKRTENNIIENNTIRQEGDNWAVIRCYGGHCYGNHVRNNQITRLSKRGKIYDQIKGANNNTMK